MKWQEVCAHPSLKNLPFKIELNKYGQIVMSPAQVYHSILQAEISHVLRTHITEGKTLTECAIQTSDGTKVADVAWASPQCYAIIKDEIQCSIAPEICIEILSSSNTLREMREKQKLYYASGAKEVWLCNKKGQLSFYNADGKLKNSLLVPDFPHVIVI